MRAMLRARLRWRPKREEPPPPGPTEVEQVLKGRIAQPGLVRGRIVGGGL
jgi:hypothetical protein